MKELLKKYVVRCDGSGKGGFAAILYVDGFIADFILETVSEEILQDYRNGTKRPNLAILAEVYAVATGVFMVKQRVDARLIRPPATVSLHTDNESVMRYLFAPHDVFSETIEKIIRKIIRDKNAMSKKGIEVDISRNSENGEAHAFADNASAGVTTELKKKKIVDSHLMILRLLGNSVFDIKLLANADHASLTVSETLFYDLVVTQGYTCTAAGKLTARDPETVRTTVLRAKKKLSH